MVALRLTRIGAKKKPFYRVVAIDSRRARDSKTIEILGHYNPRPDPIEIDLKRERIDYWLGVGAQPSDTVKRLIKFFDAHGANLAQPKRESAQKSTADNKPEPKPVAAPKVEEVEAEATATEAEVGSTEAVSAQTNAEASTEETPAAEPTAEAAPVETPAVEAPAEEAKAEEPAAAPATEEAPASEEAKS
jgi:small subunit ribosomal protein S16